MNNPKPININLEIFIETIDVIKKQREHDEKCSDAFKVILPDDYVSFYNNHLLYTQLTKILKIAMNDEGRDSWIDYYIDELNFGKDYKEGCITNLDGTNIDLSNVEKLWEFLENEKEIKNGK